MSQFMVFRTHQGGVIRQLNARQTVNKMPVPEQSNDTLIHHMGLKYYSFLLSLINMKIQNTYIYTYVENKATQCFKHNA